MWVTKSYDDKFQQEYKIERKLLEIKGAKHTLELFNSQAFDEIALLDGGLLLKNLLCVQSEFLAHLSACSHKNPKRVLIAGGFNLELAFEFLRHSALQVDFLQFDLKVLESLISFLPHYKEVMDTERFQLIPQLSEEFLAQNAQEYRVKYDIILLLESNVNANSYAKLLNDDGILIVRTPQILLDVQKVRMQLESLEDFAIKMPFFAPLSVLQDCYIFASKLYHPTADIQLQRADMLEGLEYYHANLHLSAFVLPKAVKSALFGAAKN
ncbi:spermidine synthase [Helicobacter turcicus]|uniref:Polyamine aminopropyltransferase n=1 Tax=Helicobacter turcicus TaxID=2867412 RepID=A0ABS7JMU1_9HELI|nr:spermidine synthase [Helicobacter turcicus]MBX7490720.1 spermidine synthase [Helicobacter turcicus]MBX7545671.1 spermidine synthase [Helicobacter turcicus]